MAFYDIFLNREHPLFAQKLLVRFNTNVLRHACRLMPARDLAILEIGPGKGYFYKACEELAVKDYCAVDRNQAILDALTKVPSANKMLAAAPALPDFGRRFDIIYAGFVVEHFPQGGSDLFVFVERCRSLLKPDGVLVSMVPDCERLGMEFWNIDYTHTFPTTKRSVNMALSEVGLANVDIYEVNGLATHRWFTNRFLNLTAKVLLLPLQYKAINFFLYHGLGQKTFQLDNLPFKAYALLKEPNLVVFARQAAA